MITRCLSSPECRAPNPGEATRPRSAVATLCLPPVANGGQAAVALPLDRDRRHRRRYYPYGGGIAKVLNENLPGVRATAEVTAASVDNLKLIRDGKADLAFTLADTLADAIAGRGAFEGRPVPAVEPRGALRQLHAPRDDARRRASRAVADLRGKASRPDRPAAAPR